MRRALAVWVGLSCWLFSAQAIAAGDPKVCARKLEVALSKPTPAAAEVFLKQGYADCGDGHGFLSAMAVAAAAQGDLERAVDLCLRELREDAATTRAVDVFLDLFPRVSAASRKKMLDLGTSADAPINLPQDYTSLARLAEQVYCKDTRLIGMPYSFNADTGITRYDVECPRGKVTPRFVRLAEAAPYSGGAGAKRAIDRLIVNAELESKFGVGTAEALRAEVQEPLSGNRSQAWLLGHVGDLLRVREVWALLVKKNPNDLEAVVGLAEHQAQLGQLDLALKTLRAADPKKVEVVDSRAGAGSPSKLFSAQCRILLRQNKLAEATAACTRAIGMGSTKNGPSTLAEVLYLQGKYETALAHLDKALEEDITNRRGWVVAALINQQLGRAEAAKARFDGSFGLAASLHASLEDKRTPAQWLAVLNRDGEREVAYTLAACGHHYLDLNLPKLSQACFEASEKIDPLAAKVMRLEHQAETDAAAALKAADSLLAKSRDMELLLVVARAHAHAGKPHDGIPALREALYMLPPWALPEELVKTVCVDAPLAECMKLKP